VPREYAASRSTVLEAKKKMAMNIVLRMSGAIAGEVLETLYPA
jgi:hypothetical protein